MLRIELAGMTTINGRTADHPIDSMFLERWSPRAFTGEPMPADVFYTILEAARWAPSSFNAQPWRFIYAFRESKDWQSFLSLLSTNNQLWVPRAAALIFIVSKTTMRFPGSTADVPSSTHSFDAGAAWAHIALQSIRLGWYAHAMAGFDRDAAPVVLRLPDGYRVEAAVAIGRLDDASSLPEALRAREFASQRQPLSSTAFEGSFPA